MWDSANLDGAERMVDDWQAGIEQRAALAGELSTRLAALTATARSDDGLVTVTVGASAQMTGLDLDEAIRRRPAAQTARDILSTTRAAQAVLVTQVTTATEQTLGADSETGKAVIASYAARR